MELSIVTSLYYSAPYLSEFYRRACASAEQLTHDFEFVLVNDGSPDNSLADAIALHEQDPRVCVIDLARNFGHHKAIMTGLAQARGNLVFMLDCDLEEPPEILCAFHQEMVKHDADVAYGVQMVREGDFLRRFFGTLFYDLFNILSDYPVPRNQIAARLMTRRYVAGLVAHRDREVFLGGLFVIAGFKQVPVVVNKTYKGKTTYNLRRKVAVLVNSITSFSIKPLIFIFVLGIAIIILASFAALYLIVQRIFFGVYLAGWPSLIVSIWLLGGLTIFCLGIIGVYLAKVFMESKDRPYTIIRSIYGHSPEV